MKSDNELKKLGIFKPSQATALGYSNTDLTRLVEAGALTKLDRGVYQHQDYLIEPEHLEFAIASTRFGPDVVVGGVSALFYYNLIENIPNQVWLLVPNSKKTTDKKYRFLRISTNLKIEVESLKHFKIVSLERTLVEAFHFATKIGLDQVMRATATALKRKQTNLEKLVNAAKKMGLESVINRHWESLNGLQEAV